MNKPLLIAIVAALSSLFAVPGASAQSASFTFTGVPAGPVTPGQSFTIGVFLNLTLGGNINNVIGLDYWMWQSAGSGFPFSITDRDVTGSPFESTGNLVYPQILDPINHGPVGAFQGDLGASCFMTCPSPMPSATYLISHLTFQISPTAAPGSYTIGNTTQATPGVGGRFSIIADSDGDTLAIGASSFTITTVPEPTTFALFGFGFASAAGAAYRRRSRPKL